MSRLINPNIFKVEPEESQICQICGCFVETRPYGPNRIEVCFKCGMANIVETQLQFNNRIQGKTVEKWWGKGWV